MLNADNGFVIHDVESGSVGESLGFKPWDVVATIDGKRHENIHKLFQYLSKIRRDKGRLIVRIVRFAPKRGQWLNYMKREFDVDGLSLISAHQG